MDGHGVVALDERLEGHLPVARHDPHDVRGQVAVRQVPRREVLGQDLEVCPRGSRRRGRMRHEHEPAPPSPPAPRAGRSWPRRRGGSPTGTACPAKVPSRFQVKPWKGQRSSATATGLGPQSCPPVQTGVVEGADLVGRAAHHDERHTRRRRRRRSRPPRGSAPPGTPSATPAATPCRPRARGRHDSCSGPGGPPTFPLRRRRRPAGRRGRGGCRASSSSWMMRAPWGQP